MPVVITDNEDGSFTVESEDEIEFVDDNTIIFTGPSVKILSLDKFRLIDTGFTEPTIIWDAPGTRYYQAGLDRGVLYLQDGTAVPWNGLTSVTEKNNVESAPVYYDGMKVSDFVNLGEFEATLKAVTYPDEFEELSGFGVVRDGVLLWGQKPKLFSLSYRTQINNDLGENVAYKFHVVYNVVATPAEKIYATLSQDMSLVEFEWNLSAIPEEIPGFRPSAHIVVNSLDVEQGLLNDLEEIFYGNEFTGPLLLPLPDLIEYIKDW